MKEHRELAEKELERVNGGISLHGKRAKVWTHYGGPIRMYPSLQRGVEPYKNNIPNGTEMAVDPTLYPYADYGFFVTEPGWWACHDNWWLALKESEVTIQWL